MTVAAFLWVAVSAGAVLLGWAVGNERLIQFPTPERHGTMMPLTAINLLLFAGTLWLLRTERVSRVQRGVAYTLAIVPMAVSLLILVEYATGLHLGIDFLLFPESTMAMVARLPGRPSIATSVCSLAIGTAVLMLDARSRTALRICELLLLFTVLVSAQRLIGFLFGEAGVWTPASRFMAEPILVPMSPRAASCFLALGAGLLFARPRRGLAALFLSMGAGRFLARRILPAAIALPIVFAWLGLEVVRSGPPGTIYPLSLVVVFQIAFLLIVITVNARAFERIDAERRRAEAAVLQRERLMQAVFDNAGAGIAVVNVDGRPIRTNKALREMVGYEASELARIRFTEFTHPDDVALDWGLFQELIRGERNSYRIQKRYIRKDGRQVWVQLNTSVARDVHGQAEFVIGIVEDITERRNAEEARNRLLAILEATPDFVGISDADGHALYVNRSGRVLTGKDDVDVRTLNIADFHPPAAAERILKEGLPTAVRDGLWMGETELLGPAGEHLPVSQVIIAHRDSEDRIAYLSTIMRDITERMRMEESQRFLLDAGTAFSGSLDVNAILRSIAELSVPDLGDCCAVDLVTRDGRIERAALARMRPGRQRVVRHRLHPIGKQPGALVADAIRSGQASIIPSVTDEWLQKLTRDKRHLALIRDTRPRSLMIVPLHGRDRVQGVITLMKSPPGKPYDAHDLELARALAARAGMSLDNARLFQESRQATRVRDEVLRVVAHDLRNPLNTIGLGADLLRDQLPPQPAAPWSRTLDTIERSVAQADHLIQDLLDVARMQAGKVVIEPEATDARALAVEAVDMHETLAAERNIALLTELPAALPLIQADRPRVLQVFSNLIGNALKFSPEGSTVTIGASPHDGAVRFSVCDNGPGIAESDLPNLFDPFWQARAGTGGAGLGLPIARSIVEAHGGRIWVRSRPGQGCTFYFTLPVAVASSAAKAAD